MRKNMEISTIAELEADGWHAIPYTKMIEMINIDNAKIVLTSIGDIMFYKEYDEQPNSTWLQDIYEREGSPQHDRNL
jgi:hypothetical protein